MQLGTLAREDAGGIAARYAAGGFPYTRAKLVVNEPTLASPTITQMSATDRSVYRSSDAARSNRRVCRYDRGDSPNVRVNMREKCARERPAAAARSSIVIGSA
jgi:hypothetical protein